MPEQGGIMMMMRMNGQQHDTSGTISTDATMWCTLW